MSILLSARYCQPLSYTVAFADITLHASFPCTLAAAHSYSTSTQSVACICQLCLCLCTGTAAISMYLTTVSMPVHYYYCCYRYYHCCNTGQVLRNTGTLSSVRQLPGRLLLPQRRHDRYTYYWHQHSHLHLRRLHINRLELRWNSVPSRQLLPYRLAHATAVPRWDLHEPYCCSSVRPLPCQLSVCRVWDGYTSGVSSGVILSCEHRTCATEVPCWCVWSCCWAGCYW
jgi:hypothetical protein